MRKRIYEIIEVGDIDDKISRIYDIFMMVVIICSIIPLCFHEETDFFYKMDMITVVIFICDYLLRLLTADFKMKKGAMSFILYPLSFMAIVDMISILPTLTLLNKGFRISKILRLIRTFKVFRVFKTFRYSKNINMVLNVFRKQKDSLMVVCWFALAYILTSALIIFNVEPDTFPNMFDAVYWATISLTTVGYGDIYPITILGRVLAIFIAFFTRLLTDSG